MNNQAAEESNRDAAPWFASLGPTQAQLDRAQQTIMARLADSAQPNRIGGVDSSLSLTAEWAALLRERPVANTLLAAAAAATILLSLPLGAAAAAAKLWLA